MAYPNIKFNKSLLNLENIVIMILRQNNQKKSIQLTTYSNEYALSLLIFAKIFL